MSREIKFRALYCGVWYYQTLEEIITITLAAFRKGKHKTQYTGLKDIAGTEAYEKDYDEDGNMIDWCEKCCGYQFFQIDIPTKDIIHCQNCEGNFMVQDHIPEFKIIANIYENPQKNT